jgi:hypothetical protein
MSPVVEVPYAEASKPVRTYFVEVLAIGTLQRKQSYRQDGVVKHRLISRDVALCRFFAFPLGRSHRSHPLVPSCEYVCRDDTYAALDPSVFARHVAVVPEFHPNPSRGRTIDVQARLRGRQRYFCIGDLV